MEDPTLLIRQKIIEHLDDLSDYELSRISSIASRYDIKKEKAAIKIWKKAFYLVAAILFFATFYLIAQAIKLYSIELAGPERIAVVIVLLINFVSSLILVYRLALVQKKEALLNLLSVLEDE